MNDSDFKKLEATKERIVSGMIDFMSAGDDDFDCGYTEADVRKCDKILQEYVENLQKFGTTATEPQLLECIKKAVLALNKLNEDAGGGLIETDQREDLCEYILFAAKQSGLQSDGDVTEEWREW